MSEKDQGMLGVKLKDEGSLVQKILLHFKSALINEELKPGDRIPTETSLVESFGVSRTAVREAFKMLAALGVVESRQGAGTFVSENMSPAVFDPLVFSLIVGKKGPRELLEVRKMIEVGILEVLLDKVTEEDIRKMEDANRELEQNERSGSDVHRLTDLDLKFHYAFAQAAHNPSIDKIAGTIWDLFGATIRRSSRHENASANHERILRAVKARDQEGAREAIRQSLEALGRHLDS